MGASSSGELGSGWLRVPIGADAARWITLSPDRTVLVIVRTIATASWLLDIVPELIGDPRIQVLFTVDDDASAFDDGVLEILRQLRGRVVPWRQAIETEFDLAISASHNGSLELLRAPLLLTSHGIGFTKTQTVPEGGVPPLPRSPISSVPRTTVVLSHPDQRQQWATPAGGDFATEVVGDPWMDRLLSSVNRRDEYRAALDAAAGQRLVVVSSTWRRHSLLAVHPSLLTQLLEELPLDEYRVATILHPNIWSGHGDWQVRAWLREASAAGLSLLPPFGGWRSTLVAADCLIGDHGSVTFYGAALGVPVLLGTYGTAEVAAGTPMEAFGRRAPRLDTDRLRAQIDSIDFSWDPGRYRDLVARSFANAGFALRTLREVIYRLIGLEPPPRPPVVRPLPPPDPQQSRVTAHVVALWRTPDDEIELRRFPAVLDPRADVAADLRLLAVDESEPDSRLRESAAVHVRRASPWVSEGAERAEAADWLRATLAAYPGSRLAAAALPNENILIGYRDEAPLQVEYTGAAQDPVTATAVAVAAAYASGWRSAGVDLDLRLRAGPSRLSVRAVRQ